MKWVSYAQLIIEKLGEGVKCLKLTLKTRERRQKQKYDQISHCKFVRFHNFFS